MLVGVTLTLSSAVASAPAAASEIVTRDQTVVSLAPAAVAAGPYYMRFNHSSKCAQVPNASRVSGVSLTQYTCLAQSNVWWYFDYQFYFDSVYWYRIRNANSNLCMNVAGGSQANGARIIQYGCGNFANEYFALWQATSMPSSHYFVEAYHSFKVLNIASGSLANGGQLIQYTACYCANEYVRLS